jgi:hypothetical protein
LKTAADSITTKPRRPVTRQSKTGVAGADVHWGIAPATLFKDCHLTATNALTWLANFKAMVQAEEVTIILLD